VDTLNTKHTTIIDIQKTPDDSERAIWEDDTAVYGVIVEICYGVTGYSGGMIHVHLFIFRGRNWIGSASTSVVSTW
jgi:hypothetical protein